MPNRPWLRFVNSKSPLGELVSCSENLRKSYTPHGFSFLRSKNAFQKRVPAIFDVVATNISPLVQQKHMQLRPCLDTHRTRPPTNFQLESRHIRRDAAVFSVSPRVADISQIHERTPLDDLASGDSYRLEAAQVHAHWYCKGSVSFLGRSVSYNMIECVHA